MITLNKLKKLGKRGTLGLISGLREIVTELFVDEKGKSGPFSFIESIKHFKTRLVLRIAVHRIRI